MTSIKVVPKSTFSFLPWSSSSYIQTPFNVADLSELLNMRNSFSNFSRMKEESFSNEDYALCEAAFNIPEFVINLSSLREEICKFALSDGQLRYQYKPQKQRHYLRGSVSSLMTVDVSEIGTCPIRALITTDTSTPFYNTNAASSSRKNFSFSVKYQEADSKANDNLDHSKYAYLSMELSVYPICIIFNRSVIAKLVAAFTFRNFSTASKVSIAVNSDELKPILTLVLFYLDGGYSSGQKC
jgi:hypothetical protein